MRALTFAMVLAATATPAAADRVSAGPLALRGPDQIVLGTDTAVALKLRSSTMPVRLVANTGTISPPIRNGTELRVTFTPPASRFPQLALIAAVSEDGAIVDWIAIPMAGRAVMRVDTAPRAKVIVRVNGTEFGPVEASSRGVAEVPIVVPPSVAHATTLTTTTSGAVREKLASLGARPFGTTLAVCSPHGDRIHVLATTAAGTATDRPPQVTASTGVLGAVTSAGTGVFVASISITDPATDLATITTGEPTAPASCELRVPLEAPSGIDITADRNAFVAGTGLITLRVALRHRGTRRALAIDQVGIEADLGTLADPTRADDGAWVAAWTLPDRFTGKSHARARFHVAIPGGASLTGEFVLPLTAGEPAVIETTLPGPLRADGETSATVAVRLVDRWGNSVTARPLTARGRGRLTAFVTSTTGADARYTAPRSRDPGDDVIEIRDPVSGISTRATLRLVPLPHRVQVAARAGYVSNLSRVAAPMVTLNAGARLPVLREALVADVLAGGYTTTMTSTVMTEPVFARLTTIPVLARIAYHGSRGGFDLWTGAGGGIAIARTRLTSASSGTTTRTTMTPAATVFAGAARRTGPGWLLVEGAYLHATIDGALSGRVGGLVATAGFALDL